MNGARFALCLLAGSAWLGALVPREAATQPVPLGPEIQVDTLAGHSPNHPLLAVQPGGDFEIVWNSWGPNGTDFVVARHFAAGGRPTGAPQVLFGGENLYPRLKALTAVPKGFDVLWQLGGWPGEPHYRRHLDLGGVPNPGSPVRMGGAAYNTRWVWQVRGNGFMAGWQLSAQHVPSGIAAQHLTSTGRLTGPVLRLNSRPVYEDEEPILTAVANGGFLAVWNGVASVPGPVTTLSVLRARRFSPAGAPLGPDFDVNTTVPTGSRDAIYYPKVATSPGGGFAVSWLLSTSTGTAETITPYLRLFNAAGKPLVPELQGLKTRWVESMAFDQAGNLLVLWGEVLSTGKTALKIQLRAANGAPLGPAESVASAASSRFQQPFRGRVAWTGSSWLVTWVAQADVFEDNAIFVRWFAGGE